MWGEDIACAAGKNRHELQLCRWQRLIERYGNDSALRQRAIALCLCRMETMSNDEAKVTAPQAFQQAAEPTLHAGIMKAVAALALSSVCQNTWSALDDRWTRWTQHDASFLDDDLRIRVHRHG